MSAGKPARDILHNLFATKDPAMSDFDDAPRDNVLAFPAPESCVLTPDEIAKVRPVCHALYPAGLSQKIAGGALFGALYAAHASGVALDEVIRGVNAMWGEAKPDFVGGA